MRAYRWSLDHFSKDSALLVDQGGGSTELAVFGRNFTPYNTDTLSHPAMSPLPLKTYWNGANTEQNPGSVFAR